MTTFLLAVVVVVLAGGTFLFLLRAASAGRELRAGWRRPLLDRVNLDALARRRPAGPLNEGRWPRPGVAGPPMDRVEAAAAARLATRAPRRRAMAGQVLGIIGGAWLGVSLHDSWQLMTDGDGIDITSTSYLQVVCLILVIELAALIADSTVDFDAVAEVYDVHATRRDDENPATQTPHRSRWTRLVTRLRGR